MNIHKGTFILVSGAFLKCFSILWTFSILFLHSPVLESAKINRRENVHQDKRTKVNNCENKLVYSFFPQQYCNIGVKLVFVSFY